MKDHFLISPQEADNKVCPFTFAAMANVNQRANCVSTNCMAWSYPGNNAIAKMASAAGIKERRGYCGLIHKDDPA